MFPDNWLQYTYECPLLLMRDSLFLSLLPNIMWLRVETRIPDMYTQTDKYILSQFLLH
jgi:hypothetical protein